jgi:hypothetical protein
LCRRTGTRAPRQRRTGARRRGAGRGTTVAKAHRQPTARRLAVRHYHSTAVRLSIVACLSAASMPVLAAPPSRSPTAPASCQPDETAIVIDTPAHRLHLCRAGAREQSFVVALGMSGVDKRRVGDNRTPLGSYPLGAPRASRWFHRFIPVAYPTAAQLRAGYSGSAIGIHGPPRGLETVARLAMLVAHDWTAGCIAVATDAEIERVGAWVEAHQVRTVRLVP